MQLNRLTCQQSYSNFLILSVCRFKSKLVLTSGFPTTSSARLLNLRNPQQFGTSANLDNPLEVGILILLTPPAGESTLGCGLGLPRTGVQTPARKPSAVASWPPARPVAIRVVRRLAVVNFVSSKVHCLACNVCLMRILVVEDEPAMAGLLQRALEKEGHAVDMAGNGVDALWSATEVDYDAIVLDAMIPAPDGFEVCRELRARKRWAPIIMLTARDGIEDRVRGLDAGADDYLTKPFALAELFARLRSVSRRDPAPRPAALIVPDPLGDLVVDPATHEAAAIAAAAHGQSLNQWATEAIRQAALAR